MEMSGHYYNPGNECRYPLTVRLGGLQSWWGCFGEEKNLLPLLGFKPQTA
jgi:hypothetical protein